MYLNENPLAEPGDLAKSQKSPRGLSLENVIGDISKGVVTRNMSNFCMTVAVVSQIEPKSVEEALQDDQWCTTMQEELNQFERNEV